MKIKIWLDDVRTPPDNTWTWCQDYTSAFVQILDEEVTEISFDHDLGHIATGYDLAKDIEERAWDERLPRIKWSIHSANPVGRANIERAMKKADSYWDEQDAKYARIPKG